MEMRGVWLTSTDSQVLTSRQRIVEAVNFLVEMGFNTVFPVVWNRGYTLYPSRLMREQFGVAIDSRFAGRDPLAELVTEAKRVGLRVIPWFEYGFASSFNLNGGHLLAKNPQWAALDSSGNLLKKNNFEWMNACDRAVQDFLLSLMLEVVKNYAVDGIQGDDRIALPSEGGYDPQTTALYRQQFNTDPPQNSKDPQWLQWRANLITEFVARLYQEIKAINPELWVSMSPSVYQWGLTEYLQDSKTWVDRRIVDLLHPQLYNRDFKSYRQLVDRLVAQQFTAQQLECLSPGILLIHRATSYRMSPEDLLQMIAYNRSRGVKGEVFFFYEGLRDREDALGKALRNGPYSERW